MKPEEKPKETIQTIEADARAVLARLKEKRPTRERFSLPCPTATVRELLTECYRIEVEKRGGEFVCDMPTATAIDKVAAWLTNEDGGQKTGIILCGTLGNGKTTLAKAVSHVINELNTYDEHYNADGKLVTMAPVYSPIVSARNIVKMKSETIEANYYHIPMLIIDDLGDEPTDVLNYGNVTNPIIELLYYRYNRQLATLATTNLGASHTTKGDTVRSKYGDRIADRFNEMFQRVVFTHKSYRK